MKKENREQSVEKWENIVGNIMCGFDGFSNKDIQDYSKRFVWQPCGFCAEYYYSPPYPLKGWDTKGCEGCPLYKTIYSRNPFDSSRICSSRGSSFAKGVSNLIWNYRLYLDVGREGLLDYALIVLEAVHTL